MHDLGKGRCLIDAPLYDGMYANTSAVSVSGDSGRTWQSAGVLEGEFSRLRTHRDRAVMIRHWTIEGMSPILYISNDAGLSWEQSETFSRFFYSADNSPFERAQILVLGPGARIAVYVLDQWAVTVDGVTWSWLETRPDWERVHETRSEDCRLHVVHQYTVMGREGEGWVPRTATLPITDIHSQQLQEEPGPP